MENTERLIAQLEDFRKNKFYVQLHHCEHHIPEYDVANMEGKAARIIRNASYDEIKEAVVNAQTTFEEETNLNHCLSELVDSRIELDYQTVSFTFNA